LKLFKSITESPFILKTQQYCFIYLGGVISTPQTCIASLFTSCRL
jgi:hypothetical protein